MCLAKIRKGEQKRKVFYVENGLQKVIKILIAVNREDKTHNHKDVM